MKYRVLDINQQPFTSYFLEKIYTIHGDGIMEKYFLIPNATISLCVVIKGEVQFTKENKKEIPSPVFVHGLIDKMYENSISPEYKLIGFSFKPEFMQLFIRHQNADLKGKAVSVADLFSREEEYCLYNELQHAVTEIQIVNIINTFLQRNMLSDKVDTRIAYCLNSIRSGGVQTVEALSRQVNISSNALRALFHRHVGISPKELMKICRIQRVLNSTQNKESLTHMGYSMGYYDQSHFIHEFKHFIGISPSKYFSNVHLTYDFYNFRRFRKGSFASLT
jgi:AraC-like DNA-binding protein